MNQAPPYCEGNDPIKGILLLTFANIDDANTAELLYHNQKMYVCSPLILGTAKSVH